MNESATYSESDELNKEMAPEPVVTPDSDETAVAAEDHRDDGDTADLEPKGRVQDEDDTGKTIPLNHRIATENEDALIKTAPISPSLRDPIIRIAKICRPGAVRQRNEDSCAVFYSETGGHYAILPFGLYVVADGMGGHANGHVASKMASRIAAQMVINDIYVPLLQDTGTNQRPIQEVMTDAVKTANMAIYQATPEEDSGTTLTMALLLGRRLYIAHVGDSRIYLFANDQLETVSTDHSLVQRLQEVGQLTAEEAVNYQYRHVLLRALGQEPDVDVDNYIRRLPPKGRLLLCSDGLCSMIPDETIYDILKQDLPTTETAETLFQAAMDAGGYDNITIILVEFSF